MRDELESAIVVREPRRVSLLEANTGRELRRGLAPGLRDHGGRQVGADDLRLGKAKGQREGAGAGARAEIERPAWRPGNVCERELERAEMSGSRNVSQTGARRSNW